MCQTTALTITGTQSLPSEASLWTSVGTSAVIEYPDSATTTVMNLEAGINRFAYKLESFLGICPVLHDTITIERFSMTSPADAGPDIAVCDSHSVELNANTPTLGTGIWHIIDKPSGSTPQITPDSLSANAELSIQTGEEGRYTLVWRIENGICLSEDTILVDFGIPPPQASAAPDTIVCGNTMQIMGNTGKGLYGHWDIVSGPTSVNFASGDTASNTMITIPEYTSGQYVLTWTLSSGSCTPQADSITLTFKPYPLPPVTENDSNCIAGPITLKAELPINANSLNWYTESSGGAAIGNFDSIYFANLTQDTAFWVTTYNDTTGCESPRRMVTGKIFNIPQPPIYSNPQFCGPDTFKVPAQPGIYGNTIRWYEPTSSTPFYEGDTLTYTSPSSDTLLLSSYNSLTGCEGEKDTIIISVYNTPETPVAPNVTQCDSGTVNLTATPGDYTTDLFWYEDSMETTLYDTGVSITTPFIGSPKSYWLKAVNGSTGCESPLQEVRALVYPEPGLPLVSDTSRCGTGAISLPSQPGPDADVSKWYTAFSGGTLLNETNNYTTPFLNAGNYTYWVSSYNSVTTCESERTRLDVDIFPVPVPNPIVGDNVIPVGEPNALYSMTANAGSTYEWFIPAGVDTGLINNNYVILSFPDTGNYQLVGRETNIYGCPGPLQNKIIEVTDSVFSVNLSAKYPTVCEGEDLSITSMPTGGTPSYSFEWWGDTTHATSINAGDIAFNAPTAGNYTLYVKVTDVNFKEAFDTVFITVHPNPNISIAISDSIVCAGSSEILNTNVTGGNSPYASYAWSGATEPLTSLTSGSPTFNTNTKGFYPLQVEVTDSEGCKNTTSLTIKNELPIALFEASDPDPCSPVAYEFTNNSIDAVSYNWNFGDGSPAVSDTSPSHLYINEGNSISYYNVELTAFSVNGCMNTNVQTVLSYPNQSNTIEMEPEVACDPAEVLLYGSPGNYQYHWDFGDGVSLTSGYSINHIFTNDGFNDTTYQVQLISESSLGCLDTATRSVTVYPSPQADFEVIPQVMNYPDSVANITNLTDDRNWNYEWDFDDNHTSQERDPQEHIYEAPGTYDIQLLVSGDHCRDSITRILRINPAAPIAKFAPVEPGCEPHTVTLENNSQFADSYLWEFGDGSVSNKPNPTYTYYEFGKYKIRLTVEGRGGMDTASQETEVYILPHAEFRASPRQVFVNDKPVQFFNTSVNADSYLWDFGDSTTSTQQEPEHIYKKEGQFTVELTVRTENNCFDTYELENAVLVEPSGKIVYPNVFRPSSPTPERNVFRPAIIDEVDEYHLMIFNRWGELIFESHNIDEGWDGRVKGSIAPQDVYVWKVKGTYVSGQSFVKSGDVTLLR